MVLRSNVQRQRSLLLSDNAQSPRTIFNWFSSMAHYVTRMGRKSPVIVITGTPGTGKSTHAQLLRDESPIPLQHVNVGDLVKMRGLHQGFDEEWQSYKVDEDKLVDEIEPLASAGGLILDWHTCDTFPERWIDLVVVLRCNHTLLWDRLESRGYPLKKIQENNEAEIMGVVAEEARESYQPAIVVELESNTMDDLEENVSRIATWIDQWLKDNADGFDDDDDDDDQNFK